MPIPERLLLIIRQSAAVFPGLLLVSLTAAASAQISLSTAVDLAQKSSPSVRSAEANVRRAAAGLEETHDAFAPSIVLGSSVGPPPYGFPLGNPDIYDINAQSLVFSFSQRDYMRGARIGLHAAKLSLQDAQQQVALDVSLAYVELDHDLREIAALDQEKSFGSSLVSIEQERVGAGVDPRVDELQAELTAAQVDAKRIHLENDADEMRQKIAHLTGLPTDGLQTLSSSIPSFPSFTLQPDSDDHLMDANLGLAASYANAQSRYFVAFGDQRQNNHPSVGFGFKYQRFAKYENFAAYYHNFQQNNISAGIALTIPLFDSTLRAKARQSSAQAAEAQAQADQSRDLLSEQTFAARRTIRELAVEQRVALIKSELAQEQLKTIDAELANGPGSPTAQPVSPTTAQKAHIEERERYEDLLDTNFSLMKVELNLLRMTGQINDWVTSSLK
jgi:outer membrane protein TolC